MTTGPIPRCDFLWRAFREKKNPERISPIIPPPGTPVVGLPQRPGLRLLGGQSPVPAVTQSSNNIFQLAINKDSVIRGNYYNAITDKTEQVYGSVDKQTQRAAWIVGDDKKPAYEAGLVNLTKDETSMMVPYANDRSVQATLYRIKQDGDQSQEAEKK